MGKKTIETCPYSNQIPAALIDNDGWCHEHGWDCDDFGLYLDEIGAN